MTFKSFYLKLDREIFVNIITLPLSWTLEELLIKSFQFYRCFGFCYVEPYG